MIMVLIDIIGLIYMVVDKDQVKRGMVYVIVWTILTIFWLFRVRSWIKEGRL
ncbi:hypothetical protein SAMN02799630_00061 [Paenibacillus sp. UNCCL117]|nr:hypothetical protein SAMN04488602_102471 [Paenibacillus sp. cl123]SFW11100.1 hypothetical protein SAMN02799630_00061 [Paenibacillus sp. UNCCL117]